MVTEGSGRQGSYPKNELLEYILSHANHELAFNQVKDNKGSAGINRMEVESLREYLVANKLALICSKLGGEFRPNPVGWVKTLKDNGRERMQGTPIVVDRAS